MDLNFYTELSDGTGQHVDSEFMDNSSYNGYDSVNKFAGGNDSYLTTSGPGHHFLEKTFYTPCLGDEEFEIPISLDPDSALTIEDVEAHFGELAEQAESSGGSGVGSGLASNTVVGGNDPSFASTFMNPSSQGMEHLSLGVINQPGGSALLSSTLGVDLGHSVGSHFASSSSMTIDVPINDMNHSLLGHNQLTTIDHSDLSAQLGLSLGGGAGVSKSPDQPLSTTPPPAESQQDEDMEDYRQKTMLVDSFSASEKDLGSIQQSSAPPPVVRRVGGKPSMVPVATLDTGSSLGVKKGKKKKDPNEPQKPVSAYALFFRDTQAAIKGQNPNATFGEVSKIVASMWDSLGEEQKQVYKRKTEAAKKDYLKALAAYRANQLSRSSSEVEDSAPSTPPSMPSPAPVHTPPAAPARPRLTPIIEQNTITNICASNIILDLPQVTTRSRTGSLPVAIGQPPAPSPSSTPTVTKIIISKQMLQGGSQLHQIPTSMVTVIPAGVRAVQPASTGRQPPPLQQMQGTPPPPRLQQMQTQAPPPLQAKPRGGAGSAVAVTATPPPPLQIKIVPASIHSDLATPIIVTTAASANPVISTSAISAAVDPAPVEVQVEEPREELNTGTDEAVTEEPEEMEMELSVAHAASSSAAPANVCVRAGCTNPAVESRDWDKEYCSNECVATHCRDVFMAWCSIKNQNSAAVK